MQKQPCVNRVGGSKRAAANPLSLSGVKVDIIKGMGRLIRGGLLTPSTLLVLLLLLSILPPAALQTGLSAGCRAALEEGRARSEAQPWEAIAATATCNPWDIELWEEAARQALQGGQPKLAVSYLETSLERSGRFNLSLKGHARNATLTLLAEAYLQMGDAAGALEVWKAIARQNGLSQDTAHALAALHLAQADYQAARQTWETFLAQEPQNAQAHYQLGLLLAAYDPETALLHLDQAAGLDPQFAEPAATLRRAVLGARFSGSAAYSLLASGRALASLGNWGLAAEAFRQSVLQQPGYAEAWAYLGEARQHLQGAGSPDSAAEAAASDSLFELRTALELDPDSLSAWTFLALYWQRRAEPVRALEAIQRASALDPDNPVLLAQTASIQAEAGDFASAIELYQQAARLTPYDPTYLHQIVRFALDYNYQVEQTALPIARRLLVDHPEDPASLDLMGRVLIYLGDLKSAQKFLFRALQIDPRYPPAHLHLGLTYLLQNDPTAAAGYLQNAQALDPNGPTASQARRLLESGAP